MHSDPFQRQSNLRQRLVGETKRGATNAEVQGLKRENAELKRLVAEQMLKIEAHKKVWAVSARMEKEIRAYDCRAKADDP